MGLFDRAKDALDLDRVKERIDVDHAKDALGLSEETTDPGLTDELLGATVDDAVSREPDDAGDPEYGAVPGEVVTGAHPRSLTGEEAPPAPEGPEDHGEPDPAPRRAR